ncbi:fungal-specific transcription factor domain-containing protein [Xylariaceae sp. AK1471]|nr:fungal-specific transcription factor domain-containing protein [Xylariaceae sp. AK1471]
MFATLDLKQGTAPRTTNRDDGSGTSSRPRRNVVRRACDWCKLIRIKCDSHRPCSNCQQAGRECSMTGGKQFRSITEAVKEIDTLRAQVREFESTKKQLEDSKSESPSPVTLSRRASLFDSYGSRPSASRNGVRLDSVLYGVASLPFFLTRMRDCVLKMRQDSEVDLEISTCAGGARSPPEIIQASLHKNFLPPAQEIHFLDLFWQSHYFSYPVLNEAYFRKEFRSLVDESNPGAPRKASPLVDIVLALCIQLGNFRLRQTSDPQADNGPLLEFPCLAGFQYYQRCQDAIDQNIDSPSITTVHCYIFSIVYLCEAGLLMRAQVVTGKAIMTSMMLGLHNEPPSTEPEPQQEIARRTWWSVYILDAKLSMEVGQPPMIDHSLPTCRLPSDSPETALWLAPHYPYDENCPTWLGFQTQTLRLLDAVRIARSEFCTKYDTIVGDDGYNDFAKNGNIREECARVLTDQMKGLEVWTQQVPKGYYVLRKDGGRPFLTDRAPLDLTPSQNVLIHCQRQRLLLELQYHYYCMCLCRPFICFASMCEAPTPLSDSKAVASLNHALALTAMIHSGLTSSGALFGIYDVFRWQKEVLFTIIGFAYTFPVSHSTAGIHRTIEMAIANLALFCDTLPEAGPLVAKARILADDVEAVISGFYSTSSWPSSFDPPIARTPPGQLIAHELSGPMELPLSSGQDIVMQTTTSSLPNGELLDLDLMLETWEPMDELWSTLDPNGGPQVDLWSTGPRVGLVGSTSAIGALD